MRPHGAHFFTDAPNLGVLILPSQHKNKMPHRAFDFYGGSAGFPRAGPCGAFLTICGRNNFANLLIVEPWGSHPTIAT